MIALLRLNDDTLFDIYVETEFFDEVMPYLRRESDMADKVKQVICLIPDDETEMIQYAGKIL